ncbi:MAG: CoA-binding protein [Candidatus Marinimicrobia bacterium]|nr:CoA-binding protein [Candidatus Neomarinimicrobiota bacterium]
MHTIAVVGLSPKPERASHDVARYLLDQGYKIIPVNPVQEQILGLKCYPDLSAIPEPVDLVNVFRRPEHCPPIAEEAVAIGAKALWLQLGIANDEAARLASDGGLLVVMDHCIKIEHARRR